MSNHQGLSDDGEFIESLRFALGDEEADYLLRAGRLVAARDRTGLIKLG